MPRQHTSGWLAWTVGIAACASQALAQTQHPSPQTPTFGHSMQGEAFDDGPRQRAGLIPGRAKIVFPVTARHRDVRPLVEQGIGLVHAYAYYEAERSFREAADLDPNCAIAYWGMALANTNNSGRARAFLDKALELKGKATAREQAYIDALAAKLGKEGNDDERRAKSIAILERLVAQYPLDLEARALLGHERLQMHYREAGRGNPSQRIAAIRSARNVDSLFQDILANDPNHPVHHYRIHLWDFDIGRNYALDSAAQCGPSEPGIAHMWHMCGHTYSGLKRYTDAAWYQEASSRVDHAHQRRARLMPDQIHNYAHNQQWLVETLVYTGRARDAVDVAQGLLNNPRHPSLNRIGGGGSAEMGRMRLLQALHAFEMWPAAVDVLRSGALDDADIVRLKLERLRLAGVAAVETGDAAAASIHRAELDALGAASKPGQEGFDTNARDAAVSEIDIRAALRRSDFVKARNELDRGKIQEPLLRARLELRAGRPAKAAEFAKTSVERAPSQVLPLATQLEALVAAGDLPAARKCLETLRVLAGNADLETPPLRRATLLATALGAPREWRSPAPLPADAGPRPPLESLGPLNWQPPAAPKSKAATAQGKTVDLAKVPPGFRANLVVFYLGAGCQRCRKQLDAFAPLQKAFADAGIHLSAVSTDSRETVGEARLPDGKPYPFQLLADPNGKAFRSYGAWDDFEGMPLHGAYLVDQNGKLLWWDSGAKPYEDANFLLAEAKRLLTLPHASGGSATNRAAERQNAIE